MKSKIFILILFLLLLFYLYLSHLNQEKVTLFIGTGKSYEMSLANFVTLSFVLGMLFSMLVSVISDIEKWFREFKEKRRLKKEKEEKTLLEKAKSCFVAGEKEKAIDILQSVIKKSPERKEAYLQLANIYKSHGDTNKALDVMNLAKSNVGKDEEILLKSAKLHLMSKNYERFESELKEVLKINNASFNALLGLRNIYLWKKDWNNAYEIGKRLRKLSKNEDDEKILLGIRYEMVKELMEKDSSKLDEAAKELKEILSEDKRFVPAYITLAEIYKKKGELNDAARIYGRGYTKTGHVIFLLKMEDFYIQRGDPSVILKIYRRLLEISPGNDTLSFLYAKLCLRLEMIDEAMDVLTNLSSQGKSFPGLHRALAEAYMHRRETEKAFLEMRKAFPEKDFYLPFSCTECGAEKFQWQAFCEKCGRWNTISVGKIFEVEEPIFIESFLREEEFEEWYSSKE